MGGCLCKDDTDFDNEVNLKHFILLRAVGKGAFGKVRVVQHKKTKKSYALKYINKLKCVQLRAVENVIQERRLLEEISCPFVCNLKYAFQDDDNLFMILDLMLGGDLRFHLDRSGTFSEDQIQFYAAEIGTALFYLHEKRIVHRDLKPDNILLDLNGHAHITDFNIAVRYSEDKPLKSLAGSLAYMAPEIILKKGYFSSVDWWSLGVTLYELLYGKRPFKGKNNEQLSEAITKDEIHYVNIFQDKPPISQNCTDFISQLLCRDIHQRIGTKESGGHATFSQHIFFKNLDWSELAKKELIAPFVPDANKVNFDASHELEEWLCEDNPLTSTTSNYKLKGPRTLPTGEALPPEYLMLEEKFKLFDFTKIPTEEPPPPTGAAAIIHRMSASINRTFRRSSSIHATKASAPLKKADSMPAEEFETESFTKDVLEGKDTLDKDAATADQQVTNPSTQPETATESATQPTAEQV